MPQFTSSVQLVTLFCGGLALFGIGIVQAFFPKMPGLRKHFLCLFFLAGGIVLATSIVRSAEWYVFGVVSLGWLVAVILGSEHFRATIFRCFGWIPRRPWLPVSILGLLLGIGSIYYEDLRESKQVEFDVRYANGILYKPAMRSETAEVALTDEGHPITLMKAIESRSAEEITFWERHFLEGGAWYEHVISRVPPSDSSNCHGWVFTNGRYWISPQDVESILKENHYQVVADPRPGDLAIYHDDSGLVLHSGIVRGKIDNDVLVESKWGTLGVYLHLAQGCFYGGCVTYYHSERQGHILHGITPPVQAMTSTLIKH